MSKRKKLSARLKEKYKLVILNDDTFEEKASFRASLWYLLIATSAFAIVLVFLTIVIIKITPLREYITGVTDIDNKRDIISTYAKVDSLERLVKANDLYLENLNQIISGKLDQDKLSKPKDNNIKSDSIKLSQKLSNDEKELRKLIESEGRFDLSEGSTGAKSGIATFSFFSPVKGKISSKFDNNQQHYAVDVVTRKNENIKATLDGTVVFSNFTPETGYVIAIQHANNMLSFYKHCSALLKKVGSFVRAGEVIAVVGDSGEYTTGPHLHFELWLNGSPVNPENYITF
ncbi:murein DD-endopeptidase MepM [Pedobacter glucosidilyticus]|uniref:M23 family metallopeptidase n=1 Tax=Pedobacter aquae TaxID=2605747 RepID=A0A5C0VKF0_9SPHI|nr:MULTISPECIES: M23 family metallopeptidase [Pedobacter]KHJ38652.1 murein DD-endopeptidase MepM [Pedobacter glucosidilyticus]QEK53016.1 M23 family metallopeptidase [Pedobacter aquae]